MAFQERDGNSKVKVRLEDRQRIKIKDIAVREIKSGLLAPLRRRITS